MSGDLEYLIASLPYLSFSDSDETKLRVESLLKGYSGDVESARSLVDILDEEAVKFLSSGEYRSYALLNFDRMHHGMYRESPVHVISDYAQFTYELRTRVADLRRDRRITRERIDPSKHKLPFDAGSPLEEEVALLKLQWDKISDLAAGHFADFVALIAYKIQLMILEKLWSFEPEKGLRTFNTLTTTA